MRILWVGDTEAAEGTTSCYINDYAEDLSDAELFLISRHYEAVVLADITAGWTERRWMARLKNDAPQTALVGICRSAACADEAAFLEGGGDLFIPYPQSLDAELVRLRIERFVLCHLSDETVRIGAFELEPASQTLSFNGERVAMKEPLFRTLQHLVLKRQRFMDRDQIASALYEHPEYVKSDAIDLLIRSVRQKLDHRFGVMFIKTIRSKGYGFVYNS